MKLKQKHGYSNREFEVIGDNLKIKYITAGKVKEWTVKIENIGHDKLFESNSNKGSYVLATFFLCFVVFFTTVFFAAKDNSQSIWTVIVVDVIFIFFSILIFLARKENDLHLIGGNVELSFFQDSPSKEEVDFFVNELIKMSKNLLISKYGTIDPDLPEETMLNQLNWLKNKDLISVNTYKQLKQEYKTRKLIQ